MSVNMPNAAQEAAAGLHSTAPQYVRVSPLEKCLELQTSTIHILYISYIYMSSRDSHTTPKPLETLQYRGLYYSHIL